LQQPVQTWVISMNYRSIFNHNFNKDNKAKQLQIKGNQLLKHLIHLKNGEVRGGRQLFLSITLFHYINLITCMPSEKDFKVIES